jgi:AmmeMemoRadiSam system protein A
MDAKVKDAVLNLARSAVEAAVRQGAPPSPPDDAFLDERRGCFVTLKRAGRLRGCIGTIEGREALGGALVRLAAEAALHDPRFPPVRPNELVGLDVEVSILTPPRAVASVDEVRVGIDGVIVSGGGRRGVYLPQVATETGWSAAELVARCLEEKAGLPRDAVARGAARLEVFQAEIFSEEGDEA